MRQKLFLEILLLDCHLSTNNGLEQTLLTQMNALLEDWIRQLEELSDSAEELENDAVTEQEIAAQDAESVGQPSANDADDQDAQSEQKESVESQEVVDEAAE